MGSPFIFSGNDSKSLKANLNLNGQDEILSGTVDPTSTATSATKGSLYLNTSNGNLYRKQDNGSSTNWVNTNSQVTPTLTPLTKNADYTAVNTDNLIEYDTSGATRTLTLFAASGNTGKYLTVKLTNSASNNYLSITDGGSFTTTLATIEESVILYSNGTAWKVAERYIPRTITTTSAPTIIGSVSNPTKGTTVIDRITWWREYNSMVGIYEYTQTAGGSAGNGIYEILIPGSWSADTTNIVTGANNATKVGTSWAWGSTTSSLLGGETRLFDSTHFYLRHQLDTNSRRTWGSSSSASLNVAVVQITAFFKIPITNWSM